MRRYSNQVGSCHLEIESLLGEANPKENQGGKNTKGARRIDCLSRDSFLQHQFQYYAYPQSELEGFCKGRFLSFAGGALSLISEGRVTEVVGQGSEVEIYNGNLESPELKLSTSDLHQFLRPGDWVGVATTQAGDFKVLVFAPNKKTDFPQSRSRALSSNFAEFKSMVRNSLIQRGYFEAETPTLVSCPGLEPHLKPFSTLWSEGPIAQRKKYLPTSPELHLKKFLCRGYEKVFEVKKVFRNELAGPEHRPEFWMLEWYTAFSDLSDLQDLMKSVIQDWAQKLLGQPLQWHEDVTVAELFEQTCGFRLRPDSDKEELLSVCSRLGVETTQHDAFDDLYQRLWVDKVEKFLRPLQGALVIRHFPPGQAALAQLTQEGWADRLELYINGLECANAYQELTDPVIQKSRFEEFQVQRGDEVPIDQEFMQHLLTGMPPSSGVALGLERVFMAMNKVASIDDLFEF